MYAQFGGNRPRYRNSNMPFERHSSQLIPCGAKSLSLEENGALHARDLLLVDRVDIGKDGVLSGRLYWVLMAYRLGVRGRAQLTTCLGMSTSFFNVKTPSFNGQVRSIRGRLSQRSASCLIRVMSPYLT